MDVRILLTLLLLIALSPLNASQEFPQWDLPDGVTMRLGKGKINQIEYSPDGTRLAVGTGIGIWIYDTMTSQDVVLFAAHAGDIGCLAYSPDGSVLASGSSDKIVRLWNASTGAHLGTLKGHTASIRSVSFSRDGATLASVDHDISVRFWDAVTGEQKRSLELRLQGDQAFSVGGIAFNMDSSVLAAWSYPNYNIALWDTSTGTHLRTLEGHTEHLSSVAFSPDGSMLASASWRDSVHLWDVATGNHLRQLEDWESGVPCMGFSPDGSTLACGYSDNSTRLWNAATGELLRTAREAGHESVRNRSQM